MKDRLLTVLVVEDQSDQLEMMRVLLNTLGHRVVTASTGFEAINNCLLATPDLVLLDIGLPDLDGYTVANLLRKEAGLAETPIWMLTSDADDQVKRQAIGIDRYLRKPPSVVRLVEWLDTVV